MQNSLNSVVVEKTISSVIRRNMGEKSLQLIKKRLVEKYGMSLRQAASEDFEKLYDVLKENFAEGGASNIQKQFLASIVGTKNSTSKEQKTIIEEKEKVSQIIEFVGDADMMTIMNDVVKSPKLVSDILESCNLPQTSGYRKINRLVDAGLLVVSGFEIGTDGRKVFKYTTSFDAITIVMEGGKSKIKIKPKKIGRNEYLTIPFI